jgi:shikimate dehydrogenase
MPDRYAVMGNPITHSKSPLIHKMFAEQTGQDLSYEALLVELEQFPQAVQKFVQSGGKGFNITVPFKQNAYAIADVLSERAQLAQAVNTISVSDEGKLIADNTDGVGLVNDLTANLNLALEQKNILVLGAGGAVRGVLGPLLQCQPAALVVANRTASKAQQLAQAFAKLGNIDGCGFDAINAKNFDIVVNGTSASIGGNLPAIDAGLLSDAFCYDMMYGKEPTAFLQWAAQNNASGMADGLGMLVEQAAEAFFIWRDVRPATRPVIAALRN